MKAQLGDITYIYPPESQKEARMTEQTDFREWLHVRQVSNRSRCPRRMRRLVFCPLNFSDVVATLAVLRLIDHRVCLSVGTGQQVLSIARLCREPWLQIL